jgi:hypothetical protein
LPALPITLPSDDHWLLKIIAIQDRFAVGLYRRQMKARSKRLGVPVTTRNWNTIQKVAQAPQKLSARAMTSRQPSCLRQPLDASSPHEVEDEHY